MRRPPIFPTATAVITLGAVIFLARSAVGADADNGERLARRWCVSCHVVASNQRQSAGEALPFAMIAKKPGFNEGQLAFFLLAPHPKMPDMSLTRAEAADLAAYIAKQR